MSNPKLPDPKKAQEYFEAKMSFSTGPVELKAMFEKGADINIIDVRHSDAYEEGHIPGSVSLPLDQWQTFSGLSKDKLNVIYCYNRQCHLAAKAALTFSKAGYPVMELDGGFKTWKKRDFSIEK